MHLSECPSQNVVDLPGKSFAIGKESKSLLWVVNTTSHKNNL